MAIPKPLCQCQVCSKARKKGIPYARTGPSSFLHDINLLIDTPGEIISQLNRTSIDRVDYLIFTHLDPDHIEGFRTVEQIALDFRTWHAYPDKQISLVLPEPLVPRLKTINTQYGSALDFYLDRGFIRLIPFHEKVKLKNIEITAIAVDRGSQFSFIYVFTEAGRKIVYAPCDIKPFPEHREEVQQPDILIIQPGIFETGLKHQFNYPTDHISRKTLYTFEQTVDLSRRLQAKETIMVHLEEYWNRSYDDYHILESKYSNIRFAYDGMQLTI
jgi:phosphoribosyl 1,2-cyclic phosphate phosphodiesterase